jgi:hypothetical protein
MKPVFSVHAMAEKFLRFRIYVFIYVPGWRPIRPKGKQPLEAGAELYD